MDAAPQDDAAAESVFVEARPEVRSVRLRTLGCWSLSGAVESDAATVEAVVAEMRAARTSERQGRATPVLPGPG